MNNNTLAVPFVREPYPDGEAGIQKSLHEMCTKIREAAPQPVFRSFAGNILRQANFPRSNQDKATAHFNHVQRCVGYAHDPPGTELIQNPMITLCVEGAPVCIPIEDCDGIAVALASLCAASGLEVEVVRQIFGEGHQQHVICEVKLEDGKWFPLDATTPRFKAGQKARASRETRMNPWKNGAPVGLKAEFVGIGALTVCGLGIDGAYHQLPPEMVLGADQQEGQWVEVAPGVETKATLVRPLRGLGQGLEEVGDLIPDLPKLSTKAAVIAGVGIVAGSAALAAIIRKVRSR